MPKILPWSHSALEDFKNCPRSYHAKRVIKSVKEEKSEQMIWGEKVHKAFEERQKLEKPLPLHLETHENVMQFLYDMPGEFEAERKIALNTKRNLCEFFAEDVWMRGIIDFLKVDRSRALIVDYKTGKPHKKFQQLKLFALHTFIAFPAIDRVMVMFYWTKDGTNTGEVYTRDQAALM